jgi:hypothetical protein
LLCPIFAVNGKQQAQFYRVFERLFPFQQAAAQKKITPKTGVQLPDERITDEAGGRGLSRRTLFQVAVLGIIGIALLSYWLSGPPDTAKPPATSTRALPGGKTGPCLKAPAGPDRDHPHNRF